MVPQRHTPFGLPVIVFSRFKIAKVFKGQFCNILSSDRDKKGFLVQLASKKRVNYPHTISAGFSMAKIISAVLVLTNGKGR